MTSVTCHAHFVSSLDTSFRVAVAKDDIQARRLPVIGFLSLQAVDMVLKGAFIAPRGPSEPKLCVLVCFNSGLKLLLCGAEQREWATFYSIHSARLVSSYELCAIMHRQFRDSS